MKTDFLILLSSIKIPARKVINRKVSYIFKVWEKYKVSIKRSENKRADDLLMNFSSTWIFVELACYVLEEETQVSFFIEVLIALGLSEVGLLALTRDGSFFADHLC